MASTASAEAAAGSFLRAADYRVATIAYRLAMGGRSFCPHAGPQTGIGFHHLAEYSPEDRVRLLQRYPIDRGPGILLVVPDSPGARAGLRAGDVILAVNGDAFQSPTAIADEADDDRRRERMRDSQDLVERHLRAGPARFSIMRGEQRHDLTVTPESGCPMRVRLANSDQLNAFADGLNVTVTARLVEFVASDDELAIVLAHELAHNVLGHDEALERAGVPKGFFRRMGRNASRIRQTERDADRFAVGLMLAAGFDPSAGLGFWERLGGRQRGIRLFTTHPTARTRARMWREAIELETGPHASESPD